MHKPVLMYADIHKSAESCDIGDDPFQNHSRLQVGDLLDALLKGRRLEAGRGSRPGFSSSAITSVTVGRPNVSSTNCAGLRVRKIVVSPMSDLMSVFAAARMRRTRG